MTINKNENNFLLFPNNKIVTMDCTDCGCVTGVKVNKNNCLYTNCRNIIDPITGEYCGGKTSSGRFASKRKIAQVNSVETQEVADNENQPTISQVEPANDRTQDEPAIAEHEPDARGSEQPTPEPAQPAKDDGLWF